MNKNKLLEVLSIQSESYNQWRMFAYIIRQLKAANCQYYTYNGCIYATKGTADLYPCIVSHMDTVHDIAEDLTPIEISGNITGFNAYTMEQTGIGGDDKVGIFIALQCLSFFDDIKVVFFRDEETGCEGSYDADIDFFNDCSFILQCDRRGNGDFINIAGGTQLSSDEFQSDVQPILRQYGYKFNTGMMTDVMALKETGIVCSMANISCGYYNPHTAQEYVNIADVENCLDMVKMIILELSGNEYLCNYEPPIRQQYTGKKIDWYAMSNKYLGNMDDDFWAATNALKKKEKQNCECCDEPGELQYISDYNIEMCNKCINQYVDIDK